MRILSKDSSASKKSEIVVNGTIDCAPRVMRRRERDSSGEEEEIFNGKTEELGDREDDSEGNESDNAMYRVARVSVQHFVSL